MSPAVIDRILAMVAERVFWQAVCAERAARAQEHAEFCDRMALPTTDGPYSILAQNQAKISRYEAADLRRWAEESERPRYL